MRRLAALAASLALAACSSATSPTAPVTPTPRPSADLVGSLEGDAELEGGCHTVVDAAGMAWQVAWPAGYEADIMDGQPVLLGPSGGVVARGGDRVALNGAEASGAGSVCMVGPVFEATEVVYILSGN